MTLSWTFLQSHLLAEVNSLAFNTFILKEHRHAIQGRVIFGGRVDYLKRCEWCLNFYKRKESVNAEKNENVELIHSRVFCGRLCVVQITVTKNKLYWCHRYPLVQNADCRLQTGYKLNIDQVKNVDCRLHSGYKRQTEILWSFLVWYGITCHLTTYRASRNRFSAISFHDHLH